jgi:hypothetical protein
MRKLVALLVVFGLLIGVAGVYSADAAVAKKAPAKKVVKKVTKKVVKKAVKVAPKKAPAKVAPAPPPPPPVAPVPPPPPPKPVVSAPAAPAGLFGLGWNTSVSAGYLMGKSVMVGRADLVLDDPLGIGSMLGLSAKAVNYRVGLGGATGNDGNDKTMKAIPLFIDGILNLPADMMGGIESYVGGGVNYVLYGTDQKTGTYGIQAFVGAKGDLGLGGKSFAEVGYSIIRCGDANKRSAKGISISVGQSIVL